MAQFYLDNTAYSKLVRVIRESECADPVAMLHDVVLPDNDSSEFTRAYQAGLNQGQLDAIAEKQYLDNGGNWIYVLEISVFERRNICNVIKYIRSPKRMLPHR